MKKKALKIDRQAWPLLVLAGIVPWIVSFTAEPVAFSGLSWFPDRDVWTDVFLNGKSMAVTALGIWMGCSLLYRKMRGRIQKPGKEWNLLLVLGLMELASALASTAPEYSLFGMIEQYEPVGVLLAYLVIARYAYEYIRGEGSLKPILGVLTVSVGALCVLGLTQVFQHDFWETELGKSILIPQAYAELREDLRFQFSNAGRQLVYMTLYNPDYAGIFLIMMIPLLTLWSRKGSWIVLAAAWICLIGTGSGTAWLTAGVLLVLAYMMREKKQRILPLMMGCILVLGAVWWNTAGAGNGITQQIPLEEVRMGTDAVYLTYNQRSIRLSYTIDEETGGVVQDITYTDGTKVPVVWADDRGECDPKEQELVGLHFKVYSKDEINYVQFRCEDVVFRFTDSLDTGKYEYVTINGKVDELTNADTAALLPDTFLNGRGYIWNRTVPLLRKHPLLGTGQDTFLLAFPQNDYVAKAKLGGEFFQTITSNAHSLYLQMAEQTGIPSVLCLLVFTGIYLVQSWKLYRRKALTFEERSGRAIFLAVSGYLIAGLCWASSVCTTPFFWMLLGMGAAINKNMKIF